jgi:hypothetical protein
MNAGSVASPDCKKPKGYGNIIQMGQMNSKQELPLTLNTVRDLK